MTGRLDGLRRRLRRRRFVEARRGVVERGGGEGVGVAGAQLQRHPRGDAVADKPARRDPGDAGRARQIDHHARLARPEQAEAERLDERVGFRRDDAADRGVEAEIDLGQIEHDAVGIDDFARAAGDGRGDVEGEARADAVVLEMGGRRHRRRLVGERRDDEKRGQRHGRRAENTLHSDSRCGLLALKRGRR